MSNFLKSAIVTFVTSCMPPTLPEIPPTTWIPFNYLKCLQLPSNYLKRLQLPEIHPTTWNAFNYLKCLNYLKPLQLPGMPSTTWNASNYLKCLQLPETPPTTWKPLQIPEMPPTPPPPSCSLKQPAPVLFLSRKKHFIKKKRKI